MLTLNVDNLNYLSNMINYIEFKRNLTFRKLEQLAPDKIKEIEEEIQPIENQVVSNITVARSVIYNFFIKVLDLAEGHWSEKLFLMLKNEFMKNYLGYYEPIVESFKSYLIYSSSLVDKLKSS
ncbi:hypothetical protein BBF96_11950 [Anoxybacter fermentans]|uniref:Uncharacterized protein n=1 Tax=Anoxybacter fermentans TaxID=1323375 RepID=A0A3Q9HS25_9FIRM|nr:hypothetical protein [Anoxybacter fermentans]AZR74044.1 hypothetical protein BBF96_11950 [Anoxybacter fermentans]